MILADIANYNTGGKSVGHYYSVADNYLEIFPDCKIAGGPVYLSHYKQESLLLLPYDSAPSGQVMLSKWREWLNFRALKKMSGNDTLVFQQAALATAIIYIALSRRFKGKVYLIAYDNMSVRSIFKRAFFRLAKKKIDGIICPNDEVGRSFGSLPFCVVPDYIYTGNKTTASLTYQEKKYDFCMIGRIVKEKGIVEAVDHLSKYNCKLLVAGRPDNEDLKNELKKLANGNNNIELHLGYIDDADYKRYMYQSRYAVLNYSGEYSLRSSGVIYDVLFSGLPVIGSKCSALQMVENHNCGILFKNIEDFNPSEILNEKCYDAYRKGIEKYRNSHRGYIEELKTFVNKQ